MAIAGPMYPEEMLEQQLNPTIIDLPLEQGFEQLPGDIEFLPEEDGGVVVDFEPQTQMMPPMDLPHGANLAEFIPCLLYTSPSPRD